VSEVEKIKEVLKNVRLAFARTSPLFYFQLSSLKVTYIDKYPYVCRRCGGYVLSDVVADFRPCKCGDIAIRLGSLSVSKDGITFWKGWADKEDVGNVVLGLKHELLHWMLQHMFRGEKMVKRLVEEGVDVGVAKYVANLAQDVKVNQILRDSGEALPYNWVTPYSVGLDSDFVRKSSAEEIMMEMLEKKCEGQGGYGRGGSGKGGSRTKTASESFAREGQRVIDVCEVLEGELKDEKGRKVDAETVQDFSKDLRSAREKGKEQFAEAVRRKVIDDIMKAKVVTAGKEKGDCTLLVEAEVIKPEEIAWYLKLYNSIKTELMKTVVQDWTRPNRRVDDYPGIKIIRKPRVYACVDVSGSVYYRPEVYKKFIGIMLKVAQLTDVYAVFWDTAHSEPIKVRSEDDLKAQVSMKQISAGGGTVITCLSDLVSKLKVGDFLVVLTDGIWFDSEADVKSMLEKCKALKILCWTDQHHQGFDIDVKVKLHE
jgi:predicted metal-dependent peptidase